MDWWTMLIREVGRRFEAGGGSSAKSCSLRPTLVIRYHQVDSSIIKTSKNYIF